MADVASRPWLLGGYAQLGFATILALVAAAPSRAFPAYAHVLAFAGAIFLVSMGLAYGFAPPFLKRELLAAWPASLALALVPAADAALLLGSTRAGALLLGAAFLVVPLHLGASAWRGREWRGGIALFAKDQPYRFGDVVAAWHFAAALVALAASGALLASAPRGLPIVGLAVFLFGAVAPFHVGVLAFLLPRNAKRPLEGAFLLLSALVVLEATALSLALAFAFPRSVDFVGPSFGAALATLLVLTATSRMRAESPGPQLARASPFLKGAAALAVLASLVVPLALWPLPNDLLPLAGYVALALATTLAVASTLLGAPILLNAVPRDVKFGQWAAALAIAGLFVVAPAFLAPRSAFPGALLVALGVGALLWGLWPMRAPRREC